MQRDTQQLATGEFDVLVVGGGMHGAWVALRAVRAGLTVALVERHDFGAATSANSLKILHGGLRYLQHLDFPRMRSSIAARRDFATLSPHLFAPLGCVMPLSMVGMRSPWALGPALLLNDIVGLSRNRGVPRSARLPAGRLLTGANCDEEMRPLLDAGSSAGALWWDGLARDASRLALEPLLHAWEAGAVVANRVVADRYLLEGKRVCGVAAIDSVSGRSLEIRARVVVNTAGPWAGQLSRAAGLDTAWLPPGWTGGLNLVLRRSLGLAHAVAVSSVTGRKRELFFVPWRDVTLVGTHYEPLATLEQFEEFAPAQSIEAFLQAASAAAPRARLTAADIALVHWGALPLASAADVLPAKSPVLVSGANQTGAAGLVVSVAEKLTSAPWVSLRVLDRVQRELPGTRQRDAGHSLPHPTASVEHGIDSPSSGVARLASRYGVRWPDVIRHAKGDDAAQLLPIHPDCEVLGVEVLHAIRNEMALTLPDLVLRRLGLGDAGNPGLQVLRACAELAAREWSWTDALRDRAVADLVQWFARNRAGGATAGGPPSPVLQLP